MEDLDEWLSNLDYVQRSAVESSHTDPLLICAGAGSGKTRVIMTRVAWLINRIGVEPSSILALSFTTKACQVSVNCFLCFSRVSSTRAYASEWSCTV